MKSLVVCLTLLVQVVIGINLIDTFKNDLCLNGLRDSEGNCVCKAGYSMYRGSCFRFNSSADNISASGPRPCSKGFTYLQGQCVPTTCSGTLCGSSCSPGYVLNNGFCEIQNPACPPDTYFENGFCYFQPVAPQTQTVSPIEKIEIIPPLKVDNPETEISSTSDPLDPNDVTPNEDATTEVTPNEDDDEDDDGGDIEVVPDRRPPPKIGAVNNENTVNSPTNVTSHNQNNVFIHISRHKSDGSIKAVVINNNETTVYEEKPPVKTEFEEQELDLVTTEQPQNKKCCTIVSPRMCQKHQGEWVCFHRKHYRCGTFCTSNVMYLKPRRLMNQNSPLIMPSSTNMSVH